MAETQVLTDFEPESRRNTITDLVVTRNFNGLKEIGIEVIEQEGKADVTCYETAFPPAIYPRSILSKVISSWDIADTPKAGDVAVYFNRIKAMTHVGRVAEKGKILSRWGLGGMLCKHSPLDIPVFFGKELAILYFSEPK